MEAAVLLGVDDFSLDFLDYCWVFCFWFHRYSLSRASMRLFRHHNAVSQNHHETSSAKRLAAFLMNLVSNCDISKWMKQLCWTVIWSNILHRSPAMLTSYYGSLPCWQLERNFLAWVMIRQWLQLDEKNTHCVDCYIIGWINIYQCNQCSDFKWDSEMRPIHCIYCKGFI